MLLIYHEFSNCQVSVLGDYVRQSDITENPIIHAAVCAVQVWISYAQFELSVDGSDKVKRATDVYQQANKTFRQANEKKRG